MRRKTVIRKLLQSVTEVYYKVSQVLQSASSITKYDKLLLQSTSGITKCGSYYKVRRNTIRLLSSNKRNSKGKMIGRVYFSFSTKMPAALITLNSEQIFRKNMF